LLFFFIPKSRWRNRIRQQFRPLLIKIQPANDSAPCL